MHIIKFIFKTIMYKRYKLPCLQAFNIKKFNYVASYKRKVTQRAVVNSIWRCSKDHYTVLSVNGFRPSTAFPPSISLMPGKIFNLSVLLDRIHIIIWIIFNFTCLPHRIRLAVVGRILLADRFLGISLRRSISWHMCVFERECMCRNDVSNNLLVVVEWCKN